MEYEEEENGTVSPKPFGCRRLVLVLVMHWYWQGLVCIKDSRFVLVGSNSDFSNYKKN